MFCPETVAASVTALAVAMADSLPEEDAEVAAALLTQLGDTLASILALRARCAAAQEKCK